MIRRILIVAVGLVLAGAGRASASLLTISVSFDASGTLDGAMFTDKMVTITAIGDTANTGSQGVAILLNPLASVGVTVSGVGTEAFTDSFLVYSVSSNLNLGIDDTSYPGGSPTGNYMLVGFVSHMAPPPDLLSPIPQTTVKVSISPALIFPTVGGSLQLTALASPTGSAGGTLAATPEPSTLALGIVGSLGCLAFAWRRRGKVAA